MHERGGVPQLDIYPAFYLWGHVKEKTYKREL